MPYIHAAESTEGRVGGAAGGSSGRAEQSPRRAGRCRCLGLVSSGEGEQLEVELSCQCSSENRGFEVATGAMGKVTGPVWARAGGHWAGAPGQQHSGRTAWHEWLSASALTLYVLVH